MHVAVLHISAWAQEKTETPAGQHKQVIRVHQTTEEVKQSSAGERCFFVVQLQQFISYQRNVTDGDQTCGCELHLPLNGQLLIGGLLDINDNLFVHSCSQLEALLVLVFCYGTGKQKMLL